MDPPLLIVWQVSCFFPCVLQACFVIVETSHTDFFFCFFFFPVDCPVWLMHHSVMLGLFFFFCSCFHYYLLSNYTVSGLKARCAVSGKGYRSFRAKGQCRSAIGGQGPRGDSPYVVCPVPCVDRPIVFSPDFFFFLLFFSLPLLVILSSIPIPDHLAVIIVITPYHDCYPCQATAGGEIPGVQFFRESAHARINFSEHWEHGRWSRTRNICHSLRLRTWGKTKPDLFLSLSLRTLTLGGKQTA